MNKSYLFLATGFEEVEALATADILRRANIDLTIVSVNNEKTVSGAHGITVVADCLFNECDFRQADWLILPGGLPGADNLFNHSGLTSLLKAHHAENRHIAAICASPAVVLAPLGLLKGKNATAYPGFETRIEQFGGIPTFERVTVDGTITTGNGPASAFPFALSIVEQTCGPAVAKSVADGFLFA